MDCFNSNLTAKANEVDLLIRAEAMAQGQRLVMGLGVLLAAAAVITASALVVILSFVALATACAFDVMETAARNGAHDVRRDRLSSIPRR